MYSNASSSPVVVLRSLPLNVEEFMFYQDMLIKPPDTLDTTLERRLAPFEPLISIAMENALAAGLDVSDRYAYFTVKRMWQQAGGNPINRPGYHCDGFGTDDVIFVWSDVDQTEFNASKFDLLGDEQTSMRRMEEQAHPDLAYSLPSNALVRMDARCVHRPAQPTFTGPRTFAKLTISRHLFDLSGNTRNYELGVTWPTRPRSAVRNVPAAITEPTSPAVRT
jgi:hypothetical protein